MSSIVVLSGLVAMELVNVGSKSEHLGCVLKTDDGATIGLCWRGELNPFTYDTLRPYVGRKCDVIGSFYGGILMVQIIEAIRKK